MPDLYFKPPLTDAYITNNRTAAKTMRHGYLIIGRPTKCCYQSIARWDLSSIPYNLDIISATANFFVAYNNPLYSTIVEAYQIISCWKPTSASLRHPPLTSPSPIALARVSGTERQLSFEITSLIKEWQSCKNSNLGLLFKMQESLFANNTLSLFSGNYRDSTCWPYIQINYTPADVVPCICKPEILNISVTVQTTDAWSYTTPLNVLPYNYAYTISNIGTNPAVVSLSASADGHYWMEQSALHRIDPSETTALAPNTLSRYARVAFCSLNPGPGTTLNIIAQGRT